jgi:hypothetical protein
MKWGVSLAVLLTAAAALYIYAKKCQDADEEGCKIIYEHPREDLYEDFEK